MMLDKGLMIEAFLYMRQHFYHIFFFSRILSRINVHNFCSTFPGDWFIIAAWRILPRVTSSNQRDFTEMRIRDTRPTFPDCGVSPVRDSAANPEREEEMRWSDFWSGELKMRVNLFRDRHVREWFRKSFVLAARYFRKRKTQDWISYSYKIRTF